MIHTICMIHTYKSTTCHACLTTRLHNNSGMLNCKRLQITDVSLYSLIYFPLIIYVQIWNSKISYYLCVAQEQCYK